MKTWLSPIFCLALVSVLAGCGDNAVGPNAGPHTQNAAYQQPNQNPSAVRNDLHHYNQYTQRSSVYENRIRLSLLGFNVPLADRIAHVADTVPGVEGAIAVVRGNNCVVGILPRLGADEFQQRRVMERQVIAAARTVAPNLNLRVSSDGSMVTRIQEVDKIVRNGTSGTFQGQSAGSSDQAEDLLAVGDRFDLLMRDLGRNTYEPLP